MSAERSIEETDQGSLTTSAKVKAPNQEVDIESLSSIEQSLAAPFSEPDLTIKIGNAKLYVKREHLMSESPVFHRMFTSGFKEASENEINLPEKKLRDFIYFLRYLLPGFKDELSEPTVHDVLPLAREYQTEKLMKRIDSYLASVIKKNGDIITSAKIIENLLEAEEYSLSEYLNECIQVASRKQYISLRKHVEWENISERTRLHVCTTRWEELDSKYEQCSTESVQDCYGSNKKTKQCTRSYLGDKECFGIIAARFMHDN